MYSAPTVSRTTESKVQRGKALDRIESLQKKVCFKGVMNTWHLKKRVGNTLNVCHWCADIETDGRPNNPLVDWRIYNQSDIQSNNLNYNISTLMSALLQVSNIPQLLTWIKQKKSLVQKQHSKISQKLKNLWSML